MFALWRPGAAEHPWPDRRSTTTDWLSPLTEGLTSLGRPELATLVLAVLRGLLLDLDATGDAARTGDAFQGFLDSCHRAPTSLLVGSSSGLGCGPATALDQARRRAALREVHSPGAL